VGLALVSCSGNTRQRSHSDVLVQELLGGEVIHEVLCGNEATVLILLLFGDDLLQLHADGLSDLLEQEGESLGVLVGGDVLSELLVHLLDDLRAPSLNLVESEVNLLDQVITLLLLLVEHNNFLVKSFDLRREMGMTLFAFIAFFFLVILV